MGKDRDKENDKESEKEKKDKSKDKEKDKSKDRDKDKDKKDKDKNKEKEKEKKKKKVEEEEVDYVDDFDEFSDDYQDEDDAFESLSSTDVEEDDEDYNELFSKRQEALEKKKEGDQTKQKIRLLPGQSKRLDKLKRKYLRRLERGLLLRRMIDLETISYEIAEIAPQSEYDMYLSNFGESGAVSAFTQLPDINEIDTIGMQTEKILFHPHQVQAPDDLGLCSKPTGIIPQHKEHRQTKDTAKFTRIDTMALGHFMSHSYGVIRALMDQSEVISGIGSTTSKLEFSNSYTSLCILPLLTGRCVSSLSFSLVNQQCLLCVYSTTKIKNPIGVNPEEDISHVDGVAAVWNINDPQQPSHLLVCTNSLSAGTYSAQKGYLVFAGGNDGGIYVWDLREPDHMHYNSVHSASMKKQKLIKRYPTYSTDWLGKENHRAPIIRMLSVGYNSKNMTDSEQIATLDSRGVVMFWVVVELAQRDTEISDIDFGLSIFGRVKLAKSTSITCANPQRYLVAEVIQSLDKGGDDHRLLHTHESLLPTIAAFDLEFQPDDPSQFMITTDTGYTIHCSKYAVNGLGTPAAYLSTIPTFYGSAAERAAIIALQRDLKFGICGLTIHYCPTDIRFFLIGYDDGCISLFKTSNNLPLFTFTNFTTCAIIWVRWCRTHKGLFYALDAMGCLFVFDVMRENTEQRIEPLIRSDLLTKVKVDDKETLSTPIMLEFCLDIRSNSKIAIGFDDSRIDIHTLKPDIVKTNRSDDFFLQFL